MTQRIADIRQEYLLQSLDESSVKADPLAQFGVWWQEALAAEINEVNAMTLATVNENGQPAARIVLLKDYDERGFVFYTNYESDKGREVAANPKVSLLFFWKELERQVRIDGSIEKVSEAESDAYFFSRPVGSRIGAWCSPQSRPITDRNVLEENIVKYKAAFGDAPPRPPHWGGYVVKPTLMEFWQGRASRLHDRIRYYQTPEGGWQIQRVAP